MYRIWKICRSFDTTSNTSDSVIFISKVLILLMRDFGPCFTSIASVHASVVSIASAMFATVFPTPEMTVMNINEWRIANVRDTLLAISVVFSDDIVLNFNEKKFFFFKYQKKKTLYSRAGQDGRLDEDKQTIFWGGALWNAKNWCINGSIFKLLAQIGSNLRQIR